MKEIKRHIIVPRAEADKIKELLATEPACESECFNEDETISYTANFGNSIEMDIKVCGVQYEEEGTNTPWTEAVLFDHGSEVCCSEPGDRLFGQWELDYEGKTYIVEITAEPETHIIWHNDAVEEYEALEKELTEEMSNNEEEVLWQMAYDRISQWLDDEKANLDKKAAGQLFLIGTLQRWNGAYSVYKLLNTSNIGESLSEIIESFSGDNTIRIYAQGEHVYVSQTGHDNPVNPSVFELRTFAVDFDNLDDDNTQTLMANSHPIGSIVNEVYGWKA